MMLRRDSQKAVLKGTNLSHPDILFERREKEI